MKQANTIDIKEKANAKVVTRLMFRLLPIQVLLMAVGAVNGIVSSFFATNYVGIDAMSAVGLYNPITLLLSAISVTFSGGSAILCGKYMGQNQQEKVHNIFSLNLMISAVVSIVLVVAFVVMGLFDLTGFLTNDPAVRPIFNRYLIGQAIGVFPLILGNQLPSYLIMENKTRLSTIASLVYIACNIAFNGLFVQVMHLEAFGLALASSLGLWVFLAVEASYFLRGKSHMKFRLRGLDWRETRPILRIGFPGAASTVYQTVRGLIVNWLLALFIGSVALSAFATANNLMSIFWAFQAGSLAVSRLLISVSIGEEDRQTLTDIFRVMFRRFIPIQLVLSALLILCAVPLTRIFYQDPTQPVFMMTVWGIRILPLCMAPAIVFTHFICYGQAIGRQGFVHIVSILDGVVFVAGFTALLIPFVGMNSVYIANVLNGLFCAAAVVIYSWFRRKRFPRNMEELMVIPDDFGVSEEERMDLSVRSIDEVVDIAERVQDFCTDRGIDERRAYLAGLSMEEMAGNVVEHGFHKDNKNHSVDVRVVHKGDDVILRIRDDCVPFDPRERQALAAGDDITKNIGIRMVFQTASDVQYQNILGLNVLTIRI
ncbi:MAG: ATP-binding protein [Mogibacterium sp.]|nr:ATP-binding protein [Mogibacterium sp.]